jgi:LacI family transcriptional regulator
MERKVTIQQVAELAGTSISTVSRVLSNPWYPVADETRERVIQAVRESGYKSSTGSRYSKKNANQDIGVILPCFSNPFYSQVILGMEKEFRNSGFNLLVYNSLRDSNYEYILLKSLQQKGIERVIISSFMQDSKRLRRFIDRGMKLIFLDQKVDDMDYHIRFEYKEGAYIAVKHLHDLGHRNFCLATTPLTRWSRREILAGYKKALEDFGIKYCKETLLTANNEWEGEIEKELGYDVKSGIMKARELLKQHAKTTAVLCVNDMVAFGLIQELRSNHIRVPQDISVIGFDDIPFAAMFSPALTTIRCPAIEIGQLAAQLLKQQINGSIGSGFDMKLGATLIERKTTAARR